jgi:hypothetical protein
LDRAVGDDRKFVPNVPGVDIRGTRIVVPERGKRHVSCCTRGVNVDDGAVSRSRIWLYDALAPDRICGRIRRSIKTACGSCGSA